MVKPKRPRDPNRLAKLIVGIATGERDTERTVDPEAFGDARWVGGLVARED
jgi:hypothetical protein